MPSQDVAYLHHRLMRIVDEAIDQWPKMPLFMHKEVILNSCFVWYGILRV